MAHVASFKDLMTGVSAGSEDAFRQLAQIYTPYIVRAARGLLSRKVRQKLDSQDFSQSLWASLLLKRTDLTRLETPEQLVAFLNKAAKNKVIDASRRYLQTQKYDLSREQGLEESYSPRRNAPSLTPADILSTRDPTPSQFASVRERWARIMAAASERDRRVLLLRSKGESFNQISRKLQIDPATARRTIHRIVKELLE
jgi:RNA polymerase sigma factor (sigma-70 family)